MNRLCTLQLRAHIHVYPLIMSGIIHIHTHNAFEGPWLLWKRKQLLVLLIKKNKKKTSIQVQ